MKKLLIAIAGLFCAATSHAVYPIMGTVQISTSTTVTPVLQNGAANISSATVRYMTSVNQRTQFLTVTSTAAFNGVSGSTIAYSSATFTNANVTGTLTAANAAITTGAITTLTSSSATLTGAHVTGTTFLDGAVTATGGGTLTGGITLGGAGSAVTISSNVITPGATIYAGGAFTQIPNLNVGTALTASSATVNNFTATASTFSFIVVSTVTVKPINGTNFQAEICAKESLFTITAGTATTVSANFADTGLKGTVTPHSTSSYIKLRACGELSTNNGGSVPVVTFLRNGTNLASGTSGMQRMQLAGSSANLISPMCIFYIDSPALTSTITYGVGFSINSNTVNFCASSATCTLGIQECIQL